MLLLSHICTGVIAQTPLPCLQGLVSSLGQWLNIQSGHNYPWVAITGHTQAVVKLLDLIRSQVDWSGRNRPHNFCETSVWTQ